VTKPPDRKPRSDLGQLTRDRILNQARLQFSQHGYDKTTIRDIAAVAHVDPALVIRYFTSKEQLFHEATLTSPDQPIGGTLEEVIESLLSQIGSKLDDEPVAALAMLRSMLTQRDAAESVREDIAKTAREVSDSIQGDDAEIRTSLVGSISVGIIVGRYILQLEGLRDASTEQVMKLLRPCIRSLVVGVDEAPGSEH
jgi:AcrR family transcriptional regulator